MNPNLNGLLRWGIENSEDPAAVTNGIAHPDQNGTSPQPPRQALDPEIMAMLLGGPSHADLMKEAMAAIQSPDVDLENKLIAFDNFEQMVENIDNANNIEPLGLWTPLVALLAHDEAELRAMAAWCCGTAVQNNEKAQERLLASGAIPTLAKMAVDDSDQTTRKKAIYALSSGARNYQPGLDEVVKSLSGDHAIEDPIDAGDMDAIDAIIHKLREASAQKG